MSNLSMLRALEKSGQYIFHGSVNRIELLEPKQAYHNRLPDGEPAVCASQDLDTALFMALYRGAQFLLDEPSLVKNNNGSYSAARNVLEKVSEITGYIHVLSDDTFHEFRGEMRSTSEVKPLQIIEVTAKDFDHNVHEITIQD